ncbi:MAG: amidohydrolase family protein, partial [Candidatus Thorarchaeota archaeon]
MMELEADLVVINGNIITLDPQSPKVTALAVKSYKILAMGDDDQLFHLVPNATRVLDLGGKTVIPGFVDAHTHLTGDGIRQNHVKLHSAESLEDAIELLKAVVSDYELGEWILSYGWDESQWPKKRYLNARDLDKVSKEHPIFATRIDGHLVSVNTLGFKKLGVSIDLQGVVKNKKGEPTGVLKDIDGV